MLFFFTNLSLTEFQVRYLGLFLLFSVIDRFKWFWMGSLHINIQLMLEFLNALFLVLHFSCYTLMTFLMMLFVILLSMLMILLCILSAIRNLIGGNNLNGFWTWIWSTRHCRLRQEVACWFNAGKTQLVSFDHSNNTGSIDMKMDGSVLVEKSSFEMLGLIFSSKFDWGSYITSIAPTLYL